jgi:hypothetical protein
MAPVRAGGVACTKQSQIKVMASFKGMILA